MIDGVIDGEEVTVVCAASPPNCPAISGTTRHDGRFPNLIVSPLVTA